MWKHKYIQKDIKLWQQNITWNKMNGHNKAAIYHLKRVSHVCSHIGLGNPSTCHLISSTTLASLLLLRWWSSFNVRPLRPITCLSSIIHSRSPRRWSYERLISFQYQMALLMIMIMSDCENTKRSASNKRMQHATCGWTCERMQYAICICIYMSVGMKNVCCNITNKT